MSNDFQKALDRFWQASLFRLLPVWVLPNYFTAVRFALIPAVLYFLASQNYGWSLVLFLLAAVCDSLDGSLARQRRLVSSFGLLLDPIADKLLVVLIFIFLMYFYPDNFLILVVIVLEIILGAAGLLPAVFSSSPKWLQSANWAGKSKMFLESVSVPALYLYLIFKFVWLFYFSAVLLVLVALLGLISLGVYAARVKRAG